MVPYDSLGVHANSDSEVKSGVCRGTLRLPCPPGCPQCVFRVMSACWEASPVSRPTFRELRFRIQEAAFELQTAAARARPIPSAHGESQSSPAQLFCLPLS